MSKNNLVLSRTTRIGKKVKIEPFCIIGQRAKSSQQDTLTSIGDNSLIRSHTVIYCGNKIGNHFQTGHGVLIREDNEIGNNVSIGSHTIIEHHVRIGNNVRIHGGAFIPEYSIIDENAWIGPQVTFTNAKYPASALAKKHLLGPIIGKNAKIGAAAVLLPGVKIGENSLIGAGSVVTKNVPNDKVVAGNPAKTIGKIMDLNYEDGSKAY